MYQSFFSDLPQKEAQLAQVQTQLAQVQAQLAQADKDAITSAEQHRDALYGLEAAHRAELAQVDKGAIRAAEQHRDALATVEAELEAANSKVISIMKAAEEHSNALAELETELVAANARNASVMIDKQINTDAALALAATSSVKMAELEVLGKAQSDSLTALETAANTRTVSALAEKDIKLAELQAGKDAEAVARQHSDSDELAAFEAAHRAELEGFNARTISILAEKDAKLAQVEAQLAQADKDSAASRGFLLAQSAFAKLIAQHRKLRGVLTSWRVTKAQYTLLMQRAICCVDIWVLQSRHCNVLATAHLIHHSAQQPSYSPPGQACLPSLPYSPPVQHLAASQPCGSCCDSTQYCSHCAL